MVRQFLFSAAALALLSGTAQADYTLHILHINDFHSRIEPISSSDSTCSAVENTEGKCLAGAARLKTAMDDLRAQLDGQNVLSMIAGDVYQGSLMYNTYRGLAEAEVLSDIGFDVMAVGNHEFDDGNEGLVTLVDNVPFPVIAGNLDLSNSPELKGRVADHALFSLGGRTVGVIAALATDTTEIASPGAEIVFADEIESLTADAAALREQGADIVIALTHMGVSKDMEAAEQVPGIDAVVGGHTHTLFSNVAGGGMAYPTMVGQVPVVSANNYGKYLGHLVLTFDDAGTLIEAGGGVVPITGAIPEDPALKARIRELAGPIAELRATVVAEAVEAIDGAREHCRQIECTMGNLVADAQLERVKDQGIRISLANGGNLRASIAAGPVTMGDVLTVLPFQNTLSTFEVSGATVLEALENSVSKLDEGAGRFLQVAGIRFTFDPAAEVGHRVSAVEVQEADGTWSAIDPAASYGVVSNNYIRGGGDGFAMFVDAEKAYDFGPDLADVVAEYLSLHQPYQPYLDGRIALKE